MGHGDRPGRSGFALPGPGLCTAAPAAGESHDLHAAFRIGDYVAMLDSGKVLLHGPPKVFLESDNPLVARFVSKGVNKK